ncbi:MFS transporter [Nocardia sp. NPDC059091]|uniref:MFS transporter n=1 Tax=unclassified Nocardia TaxID=2637762 RepID=UPI0036951988
MSSTPTESGAVANPVVAVSAADTRRVRGQLALLSGLISMDNSEASVISTLFPAIRSALDLKLSALGNLMAVSKILTTIAGPMWVLAAARYGRKNVLVVCCGLWGVWSIAAGFSQNYLQLFALYVIAAIGYAAGGPLVNGILADLFGENQRGRAAGWLYAGFAIIGAFLTPLLGLLSNIPDGWRYGFFLTGAITVCCGLLVRRYYTDPGIGAADAAPVDRGAAMPGRDQVRAALRIRTLWVVMAQRATTPQLAFLSFAVTYMVSVRHFSNAQAALVSPFAMLAYVLGTVLGGYVVDRVGACFPGFGRVAVWQASVLSWAAAAALCTQIEWPSIWVYAMMFALLGLLQGFGPGSTRPIVMAVSRPEIRSAAFALFIGAESVGWALSTLALGYVGDAIGLQDAFLWLIVVLGAANGVLMTLIYRLFRRESAALRAELAAALADTASA